MFSGWQFVEVRELIGQGVISGVQDGNHGNDHPKSSEYVNCGIPFIMARDLEGGRINTSSCAYLKRSRADRLRIGFAETGDILLSHKGTVGAVAEVQSGFDYVMLTPQVTYYRIGDPERLSREFLKQVFLGPEFQSRLATISAQSTRAYVGITEQKRLKIPLPPLPEQRRIADILRTWDEAIEKLEALRMAKERRLQGALYGFFGPTRVVGGGTRPKGWTLSSLGDSFVERKDKNTHLTDADVVTVGKYRIGKQTDHFTRSVASKDLSPYWIISSGDFVYDPMSAYYGALGRYNAESDGLVSPAYRVIQLRRDIIDSDFMVQLLRTAHVRFLLEARSSQGNKEGKRRSLQRSAFDSIEFFLPPMDEQKRLAAIAADFEADIASTAREITALQRQKRGLMQKLLTGEWRVSKEVLD